MNDPNKVTENKKVFGFEACLKVNFVDLWRPAKQTDAQLYRLSENKMSYFEFTVEDFQWNLQYFSNLLDQFEVIDSSFMLRFFVLLQQF